MRMLGNMKIVPLEEGLKELGLDPEKALGEIHRTTALAENRANGYQVPGGVPTSHEPAPAVAAPAATEDPEELDEAFKIVKKMFKTAGEKMKGKLARKKIGLGKLRRAAKMFRKKFKRKIMKRAKKKLAKFGAAGLAKMHKMRKRIVMDEPAPAAPAVAESGGEKTTLQQLREDLNALAKPQEPQVEADQVEEDTYSPYEEAAFNAGMLSCYLGEVFELAGDAESAKTMYDLSDEGADLSEMLDGFDEGDQLDEDQEQRLGKILEGVEKGLRLHEEFGHPLPAAVIEYRLEHDAEAFLAEGQAEEEGESAPEVETETPAAVEVDGEDAVAPVADPPAAEETTPAPEGEGVKPGGDLAEAS